MDEDMIKNKIKKFDKLYVILIAPITFLILIFFNLLNYFIQNSGKTEEKDILFAPALVSYTLPILIISIVFYLFAYPLENKRGFVLRLVALFFIVFLFGLLIIPSISTLFSFLAGMFGSIESIIITSITFLVSLGIVIYYSKKL